MLDNYEFLFRKREEFSSEPLIPQPLITGRDLMSAGRKSGPIFKKILDAVQALQLEGALNSKEEALAWVAMQKEFNEVTMNPSAS
jgi:poly(A) polymerase